MKKAPSEDQAATEAPANGVESDVEEGGVPVVPAFGMNLPRLPTVELSMREQRFMFEGFEEFFREERTLVEFREAVEAALRRFDERETFEDAPLEALRQLGLAALRPGRFEDLPNWQPRPGSTSRMDVLLRDLQGLRRVVWSSVEQWQQSAIRHPLLEGRQQALAQLRKFTGILVPDTRGKRRQLKPPPTHLQLCHRQLLFRLQLARQLADAAPKGQAPDTTLADVSRGCGLPEEWIRDWLFFSDRWERKARPQTSKRMALELLAEIADMDPDSIATLISRGRRSRSRKGAPT